MEVSTMTGDVLGSIEQLWSIFPSFHIKNPAGEIMFRISAPFCTISCCGDVVFEVLGRDGETPIGKISKQWTGFLKEAYTDADNFGINFPVETQNPKVDLLTDIIGYLII